MAAIPSPAFWATFLPVAKASILPGALTRLPAILPAAFTPIPNIIDTIWEGILKAVPKKKTSYSRKRMRQLAPEKKLKDVTFLVKCSSCGRPKRAHILCPYCVASVKNWFSTKLGVRETLIAEAKELPEKLNPDLKLIGKKRLEAYPAKMEDLAATYQEHKARKEREEVESARARPSATPANSTESVQANENSIPEVKDSVTPV